MFSVRQERVCVHLCFALPLFFRALLQLYCLKDGDFEERCGSPLPFIMRRNPHHPHGGSMTLFLEEQVQFKDIQHSTPFAYCTFSGNCSISSLHLSSSELTNGNRLILRGGLFEIMVCMYPMKWWL